MKLERFNLKREKNMSKLELEINLDKSTKSSGAATSATIPTKSCSLNALNTELASPLSTSQSSQSTQSSSSPPPVSSPDSVKAKLNGLLALSKKASTNSLELNSSQEIQIDPSFLSLISSSSVILTPSPSPTPGKRYAISDG